MDINEILMRLAQINLAKQQRIEKHGGNWRTSTTSQSGPAQQPDHCAGGSGSQGAGQGAQGGSGQDPGQSGITYTGPTIAFSGNHYLWQWDVSGETMAQRRKNGKWAPPWMSGELGRPNDAREWCPRLSAAKTPVGGVQAGEIIAWRAWHWNGKRLRSIFVDYEWPIHKAAEGQPNRGYGLHAFKEFHRTMWEYDACLEDVLIGEVALWGDVIEFEQGYTAEFGKVLTLVKPAKYHAVTDEKLAEVRALYGAKAVRS